MPSARICTLTILAAWGLLLAQAAMAADDKGQYGVRGAGLVTCSVYEKEREARSEVYRVIAAWIDGYITGVNQHANDTYDVTSFEGTELLAALISEHCRKSPEKLVFTILKPLVEQTSEHRLRAPSPKTDIVVGERRTRLYRETVKRLQQKLADGGFYTGDVNGAYGSRTREAMRSFQQSIEFEPTGFPDQLTLWRLFYQKPSRL